MDVITARAIHHVLSMQLTGAQAWPRKYLLVEIAGRIRAPSVFARVRIEDLARAAQWTTSAVEHLLQQLLEEGLIVWREPDGNWSEEPHEFEIAGVKP